MNKLPDNIAACNLIKYSRKRNKKYLKKSITINLFDGVSTRLTISYLLTTGHESFAHSLRLYGKGTGTWDISPTKNNKLSCSNQAGINYLYKSRDSNKKRNHEKRKSRNIL